MMTRKNLFAFVECVVLLVLCSPRLGAGECTIDSGIMDRGERKSFMICGDGISTNYVLQGFSEANIRVAYQQHVGMCGVGVETPGIYLVLEAEDNAETASVSIVDGDTGSSVCDDISITVADRIHVAEASLTEPPGMNPTFLILEIDGDETQDLSQACEEGLSFPEGKCPSLSLLSQEELEDIPILQRLLLQIMPSSSQEGVGAMTPELKASVVLAEPLVCTESSIVALVKVQGQQRYPAKIVISKVGLAGGQEKEGVAYATLPPPEWLEAMKDDDAKYVNVYVNGEAIRTRYYDKGKGDALLYVHGGQAGSTSNAQNFEQNYDYLSKYFHVYCIDKLGMGYTDNPKTDDDYKAYYTQVVDHVYEFMRTVGIEKVHLIGHSQGGWPVTRIAIDHPEMVKSLVIVDSGTMAPPDPLGRTTPFMIYNTYFIDPPEGATRESIRRGSEFWSYSMNNITDEKVERAYRLAYLPKMTEASTKMRGFGINPGSPGYQEMKQATLDEMKAGKLRMPTVVIWGYNDPSSMYDRGIELFEYLSGYVPGSRLLLFDECGHAPYVEYPELFSRTIKSFCGAYSSRPIR